MSAILLSGEAAAWPKQPKTPSPAAEVPSLQANRDWEIDRALMLERSERRAWAAAAAGLAIGLIGIAAVFVQGPLRKVVEIRKDIKHLHLSVLPPMGRVRISAPQHMKLDTIRVFAISRLAWIKTEQHKMQAQPREAPRQFLTRESHYVWGQRCLLTRHEHEGAPKVELNRNRLGMWVRPGTDEARCQELLDGWYRDQIRATVPALIANWSAVLGVKVDKVFVQRMKTRWGSCNPTAAAIRLNTELAKKPAECLEYIVVHELTHLLEPTHGPRFVQLMDHFLPHWQQRRELLNALPVRHHEWGY